MMETAIWWIRRDLRLRDNQALKQAMDEANAIVPLFILDPTLLASPYVGDKRLAFLFDGLRALDKSLRERGSRLVIRRGDPASVLSSLKDETDAGAIYAEADVSPYARQRDARVAETLPLHLTNGLTIHPYDAVLKDDGDPYIVYSYYSRTWKALPLPDPGELTEPPKRIATPEGLSSESVPESPQLPASVPFVAGEEAALERLRAFTEEGIEQYAARRDRTDLNGTSGLSPFLRFGMLSARRAAVAALEAKAAAESEKARQGAQTWLDELIWREFYISILFHFPGVREHSFRETYRDVKWENDPDAFAAWQEGRTGYPIVDAAMHQLQATGWMHNRARMIVAAFLTKDLLIDWRWGEKHFIQHLIDGDPAANNGGWQWSAGTGTDAAPYFRIFNPVLQGERHDPHGDYIRRWVPALEKVPKKYIHEPWTMPEEAQEESGCRIGHDYPAPIVDHQEARERALAAYRRARD
ncbi:MAG: cryptochrome/photolyase family protein [Anaerolineae bacterium]